MPYTREQLEAAVLDAEAWLDNLDPAILDTPEADASDLRAIADAQRQVANGDLQLADAVARARANGRSWGQIGVILGVSKQAARERFGAIAHS
jgi:hypothetical protein